MGRDLCMFFTGDKDTDVVWFKIIYRNTTTAEAKITDLMSVEGVEIRFAYLDNTQHPENGKYVLFTQMKKGFDTEELVKKLKDLNIVLEVEHGISQMELIHSAEFPLNLLGERAIIARAKTIVDLIRMLYENVHQADGLLVLSGVKSGAYVARYVREITTLGESNYREILKELFIAAGWGILKVECDCNTLEGRIIVRDSFIANEYEDSENPTCAYMSGFFAGYLTEVMGKPMQVHENRCKAIGDSFCEHLISPAPLESKPEHFLRGETY